MRPGTDLLLVSTTVIVSLLLLFSQLFETVEGRDEERSETEFCQRFVRTQRYRCEEHKMYTNDGFALLLHRVGIIEKSSPAETKVPSAKEGDIEFDIDFDLTAASEDITKKDMSTSTPEMGVPDFNQVFAAFKDGLASEGAQPYQLGKANPDSVSEQPIPEKQGETKGHSTTGAARDSPEFRPVTYRHGSPKHGRHGSPKHAPLSHGKPSPHDATLPPSLPPSPPPEPQGITITTNDPLPDTPLPAETSQPETPAVDGSTPGLPNPLTFVPGEVPGEIPGVIPGFIPGESPPIESEPTTPSSAPHDDEGSGRCVLLLHFELLNGDSWFKEVGGHEFSPRLPFLLAENSFDVWVGHGRATYWSHDHEFMDSSNQTYWNWSWDAFVEHDVPTMLAYLNRNTLSKVHVVGVSQSAAVAVAAATKPDVARLMKSLVLVGPTIFHGSEASPELRTWAGIFARVTDGPDSSSVSGQFNMSRDFDIHSWSLGGPASIISGPDCCITTSVTLFDNGWDGTTSYKNFQHFEQCILQDTFQRFDYGSPSRNQEAYGQSTPAPYLLESFPADLPVQIIYGGNDFFASPEGIQELLMGMPGLPATVYLPLYAHFDLFFSGRRTQDVYLPILSFLLDPAAAT